MVRRILEVALDGFGHGFAKRLGENERHGSFRGGIHPESFSPYRSGGNSPAGSNEIEVGGVYPYIPETSVWSPIRLERGRYEAFMYP